MPSTSLADAALDLLRTHGPLDDDEWVALLAAEGLGYRQELEEFIESFDHPALAFLPDGRNLAVDTLRERLVLTHRLTEEEIATGSIDGEPDLIALLGSGGTVAGFGGGFTCFPDLDAELLDGRAVVESAGHTIVFPPTAFHALTPGTLVGLRVSNGVPTFEALTAEPPTVDLAPALAAAGPEPVVVECEELIWSVVLADPTAFTTPTAPLSELLDAAGYHRRGALVAPPDHDWAQWERDQVITLLGIQHAITREQAKAVLTFAALVRALAETPAAAHAALRDAVDIIEFTPLADMDAVEAAHTETMTAHPDSPDAYATAAEHLVRHAPRTLVPAARWLAGKAAERTGRLDAAEHHFEAATTADPYWEPAVLDLARYAADRGNYARAIALVERLDGGAEHPYLGLWRAAAPQDLPGLGRNDRCWCGSGRKYKVCHLGKSELSPETRAALLYSKATVHAEQIEWQTLRGELTDARLVQDGPPSDDMLRDAFTDPLVVDVLLFEGGVFDDFLRRRGALLPPEDLLLAQQWQLAPHRTVFEVDTVRPAESITIRDIATGDRHTLTLTGPAHPRPGEFYCTHLVPLVDESIALTPIEPVSLAQRTPLLELLTAEPPDPVAIVEFLSARYAPTRLVTSTGEPMVMCEAIVKIRNYVAFRRELDARFESREEDHWVWLAEDDTVLGEITFTDKRATVRAMSEERFDTLLDLILEELSPTARVIHEDRIPAAELFAGAEPSPEEAPSPDLDDPAVVAVIDDLIRRHEITWLDEPIPALGNRTPRDCVADPTRRDDVIRLIDSFPQEERPGQMSAARLRQHLHLE